MNHFCLSVVGILLMTAPVWAERPPAPRLLPEKTLAYFRMANVPDGVAKFKETALGRIGQDEEIAPLVSKAYAAVVEAWEQIEDRVGVTLTELLQIPQGEVCAAVMDLGEGPPAVAALIDVKDRSALFNKLVDKLAANAPNGELEKGSEMIEGTKVTTFTPPRGRLKVFLFERDGTVVISPSEAFIRNTLKSWEQGVEKSLADSKKFNAVMSKCRGTKDEPPQLMWFVDPVETARVLSRGNTAAQTGLILVSSLGVDGIQAVGGSSIWGAGELDQVAHFHLLLESPRDGVLELLALGTGDVTPQPWVPSDAANYITLHWKLQETFRRGAKLYNSLTSEGAFERETQERLGVPLGLDFEKELLPAFDGRVTYFNWMERPARLNSGSNLIGLKLVDLEAFKPVFDKLTTKFAENLTKKAFGGITYWRIKTTEPSPDAPPSNLRQPTPCLAILGDYLLVCDSEELLHHSIAAQTDPALGLASQLDFKLIAGRIKRAPGGEAPSAIFFNRPEEGLKLFYDLAQANSTKQALEKQAENNRFFKSLDAAVKDHPLPPFGVIAKYLAPGGGLITSDETGIHWMTFSLRRK